jgi:carboxylesterase type B
LNPWGNSEAWWVFFSFFSVIYALFNRCASILMNIFTPYLPGKENPSDKNLKPVLFWLHGGGSTAMDATYDGVSLASRSDVVIVSINWRGGNFGMFSFYFPILFSFHTQIHLLTPLTGTLSFDDGYVDGNYGIADIVTGLQWVQDHIKVFGGDNNKVTIFGQSAGGESVVNMIRSPKAAGLFSGAIVQSGALGPAYTQEEIANVTGMLFICDLNIH